MIWVGTDDGRVQVTRDSGRQWTDLTPALAAAGTPRDRWVSRVFPSSHDGNVAYVAKNGFRNDDFAPYLYRTADGGKTWTSIAGDLPRAPINVVVQDRANSHLLIVGNDLGVWVSVDDGARWMRWQANLPTVPVHDLTIHPRENDLVLATYGRALWVGNMQPLRELSAETLGRAAYLFDVRPAAQYSFGTQGMNFALSGDKYLRIPNEPEGLTIHYWVRADTAAPVRITVTDTAGTVVRQISPATHRGLNRVVIPFVTGGGGRGNSAVGGQLAPTGGRGGAATWGAAAGVLAPGRYTVILEAAGERLTKPAVVRTRM